MLLELAEIVKVTLDQYTGEEKVLELKYPWREEWYVCQGYLHAGLLSAFLHLKQNKTKKKPTKQKQKKPHTKPKKSGCSYITTAVNVSQMYLAHLLSLKFNLVAGSKLLAYTRPKMMSSFYGNWDKQGGACGSFTAEGKGGTVLSKSLWLVFPIMATHRLNTK